MALKIADAESQVRLCDFDIEPNASLPAELASGASILERTYRESSKISHGTFSHHGHKTPVHTDPHQGKAMSRSDARAMMTGGAVDVGERVTVILKRDPYGRCLSRDEIEIIRSDGMFQTRFFWDRKGGLCQRTEAHDDDNTALADSMGQHTDVFDVCMKRVRPVNVYLRSGPSMARHLLGLRYPWHWFLMPWRLTANGVFKEAKERFDPKNEGKVPDPDGLIWSILKAIAVVQGKPA